MIDLQRLEKWSDDYRRHTYAPTTEQPETEISMKQPLQLSYDPDIDVLSIEGVHYSGEVFRRLSLPLDRWVRLYRRDYDRVVCIQELDAGTVTPEGFVESEAPKGRVELP